MKQPHNVLLIIGGLYHDYEGGGRIMADALAGAGMRVTVASDAASVSRLAGGEFDSVLLYTQGDKFDLAQVDTLAKFVQDGGGLVGIHSAASTNRDSEAFNLLLGSRFTGHGPVFDFDVSVSDPSHPIAQRVQKFPITDELYLLEPKAEFTPFLTAWWNGKPQPMAYSRAQGNGRVVYLANGHDARSLSNKTWQQILLRSVRYAAGEDWTQQTVKVAAIGYGGAFNMGKHHLESCRRAGMTPVAVCDLDPKRREAAKVDFGASLATFADPAELLRESDADLCIIITPHNTHAPLSLQCLNSGRHVVTEKPYTITIEEATQVIATARRAGKMATVFHNRRWDGDFLTIKRIIDSGAIGDVFHIECGFGGFNRPRLDWWRSHKEVSGGALYDWGAHFVDWVLDLMPHKIVSVSGDFKKFKWHQVSNEDYTSAYIRFEGGRSASIEQGDVIAVNRSKWRILGTLGAIQQQGWDDKDGMKVVSFRAGVRVESIVQIAESDWDGFYRNVADHLILGEALAVTPESARNVIAVIRLAEESSKQGGVPLNPGMKDEG